MITKVNLRIADINIEMISRFPLEELSESERIAQVEERFKNFLYAGNLNPDISIRIEIVKKLPLIKNAKLQFITYHFQDKSENWRFLKVNSSYIFKSPLEDKKQLMLINKDFVWNFTDIIYDFSQVLLINYLAQRNEGIFTHSVGIKDLNGEGIAFIGKSGAGKSTIARFWYNYSKAMFLNDDRIIVRRCKDRFFIFGSPWHGTFSDYLKSKIESAPLKKIFFIHHAKENCLRKINQKQAFILLYPSLFPTFWDQRLLGNITTFCFDLLNSVDCYSLGFRKDKSVIDFIRQIK